MKKVFWCTSCLNMSTRPRIEFNDQGECNACVWSKEKESFSFAKRCVEFEKHIESIKGKYAFDCIVPVSGGKDGSYVATKLRDDYGMNVLAVTVRPALELELGSKNLQNFINSGFSHIHVSTNNRILDELNKEGFKIKGFPYYGWLIAIHTAVINVANSFNIPLVVYGEDGEIEYGGSTAKKNISFYDTNYMRDTYLEGGHNRILETVKEKLMLSDQELYMWKFPESVDSHVRFTHWSYWEGWDSYRNYVVAKEKCGLEENEETNQGTFTNFAQNDQALYSLHAYLMYLKFGFGRATQDAGIEIRRGAMNREQAIELVKIYDNHFPEEFLELYLEYYQMSEQEFFDVLEKHSNKSLFKREGNEFLPQFEVGKEFML
jgi:N-acetyl sugar amidotransferase